MLADPRHAAVRDGQPPGEAARRDPENPRLTAAWAVGLNDLGRTEEALAALDAVLRRFPWDAGSLLAAATMSRDRGDLETAREYADRLLRAWPDVPAYRQLAQQLRQPRPVRERQPNR